MPGLVVWLTGLPGSGKTTIGRIVLDELRGMGYRVELLDGDWVRATINVEAGFTREERRKHLLRVAWIARLLARNDVMVICSFVSPYRDVRKKVREIIEEEAGFSEVYVKCSLEEAIRRDPKGLYRKALRGEIKNFTGVSDPYEEPMKPDLTIDTEKTSIEEAAAILKQHILNLVKEKTFQN